VKDWLNLTGLITFLNRKHLRTNWWILIILAMSCSIKAPQSATGVVPESVWTDAQQYHEVRDTTRRPYLLHTGSIRDAIRRKGSRVSRFFAGRFSEGGREIFRLSSGLKPERVHPIFWYGCFRLAALSWRILMCFQHIFWIWMWITLPM